MRNAGFHFFAARSGGMTAGAPSDEASAARLRKRADFQRAAKGARVSSPLFTIQMAAQGPEASAAPARFGFTVTKKVANAVGRNRIRRRLKEALRVADGRTDSGEIRAVDSLGARPGRDYVFVARRAAIHAAFIDIVEEIRGGFARLNRGASHSQRGKNRPRAS